MLRLYALLVALFGVTAATGAARLDFAHRIPDADTWRALAARPASSVTARTEVVKFIVDRRDARRLWFQNASRYPVHFHFARDRIPGSGPEARDHQTFNTVQYTSPDRRFEMGSVVHYLDADIWTLELTSGDTLDGTSILRLFGEVRAQLWVGAQLRFRSLSDQQQQSIAALGGQLPTVTTDDVFHGVNYQPLTTGRTYGYLRIVPGALDLATVRADQILALAQLPEEIPVNAGIISQPLQAPLGHIAILSATRGTPNMGLRDALARPDIRALDGKLVRLDVGAQDFSIQSATLAEAQQAWRKRRPQRPQVPALATSETRLLDVASLRLPDARFAGAKAAQLGEVMHLDDVNTPGGFVIPLSRYIAHLHASGAADDLAVRLADSAFASDAGVRSDWLAQVRERIEAYPVDAALVQEVRARIAQIAPASRWILRSSTNAEDLAGFTGAGLYRSIRVKAGASDADVAAAIRQVWASVWLQAAFEERSWYRIDHSAVGMAILVQPFVDGAVANGVAITANPYTAQRPAFFINAQSLGGSVTGAGGNEIPEQFLVYTFTGVFEPELLSRSSRMGGGALLGDQDLFALSAQLQKLHEHLLPRWHGGANAVDVEYLIAGQDRHVVILQARPYTVRYARGQRLEDLPFER